ncbi:ABC transporter ATP-binding protein [Aquicella lusitana]|uniref:Putative ABC transport system ATP-binding protein n=1 Tax=Aquicella lusitana TaxID=254246 RepID=A0A370GL74_9COXI|nr:ATP-binding cassette domain-containing protein [Aquicella lusitana]RDI44522.1 putative ABC transport system ATP-binding protein [Aquicella lusitana]VVC72536.1 Lipoprotein-releasing system ATP-binding protein LolD [Aquicella lusitana]
MPEDTSSFLLAEHVSKRVHSGESEIVILKDVNVEIKPGESIAILGASGSGKTTLLTLLAGLDLPTSGDIFFQRHHLNDLDEEERAKIRALHVGFIFQSFQLLPALTALENVMLPLEIQYIVHEKAEQEAAAWLDRVGLGKRLHHYPAQLSGGEQQRVAIARAFVNNRKIIFADEMTGNLDVETGKLVADRLFELNRQHQTTLVLVTHDEQLAARCGRRLLLREGMLHPC